MRLLCVGDVFGRPGREALLSTLPALRRAHSLDLVIANGENSAHGAGLTPASAKSLFDAGVDVITSGNHIWQRREIYDYLRHEHRVIRPLNYPTGTPGRGSVLVRPGGVPVLVLNAMGRLFMKSLDDPFRALDDALSAAGSEVKVIVVDFHAEATSEKRAMGYYLDGRVSAMFGTHTHVPTADAQILPNGTAYVTDLGMTGPSRSVIGMAIEPIIAGFTTMLPNHAHPADGAVDVNTVLIEINIDTGKATSISRLDYHVD